MKLKNNIAFLRKQLTKKLQSRSDDYLQGQYDAYLDMLDDPDLTIESWSYLRTNCDVIYDILKKRRKL